jgi:cytochrome oxidase Cu insertion factor (SCO1/SenC/PrrC family)
MTALPIGRRAALGLALGALAEPAAAHEGHQHGTHDTVPAVGAGGLLRLRGPLPDPRVTDAARRRRRLTSEVIGGRVVAIDFVLTGCASLCGVVSAAMAGAQEILGARLPREAGLLSIALDPFGDTPEALTDYGARFGAGPGWSLVNIPLPALDEVLRRLGGPQPGEDHAPMVVVLDPLRGEARRLLGLPAPERIAAAVTAALDARRIA